MLKIKFGVLLLVLISFTKVNAQSNNNVIGTWVRYSHQKVAEVFIQNPDHGFISNLFDEKGMITGIEKGAWKVTGDTISFTFLYAIELKDGGKYTLKTQNELKSVSYPFAIKSGDLMIIGKDNRYYRQK